MRYLPVNYDTKNKNVLILGGGLLALSKIKELLNTEFKIYVIADSFVDEIKKLAQTNSDRLFTKEEKLTENFIFFAYDYLLIATNNFELNAAFEKRAQKSKILYERCDITSESTMLLNKVIEKDGLTVGISSSKLNPTITGILYEDISAMLEKYSSEKIKILNKIRTELIRKNSPNTDEIIRELYDKEKLTLDTYLKNLNYKPEQVSENTENKEETANEITDENIEDTEIKEVEKTEVTEVLDTDKSETE